MLHSSALGSRNTFGQDVVNRENGPQSMGALNEYAACWSRKCENFKRCEFLPLQPQHPALFGAGVSSQKKITVLPLRQ